MSHKFARKFNPMQKTQPSKLAILLFMGILLLSSVACTFSLFDIGGEDGTTPTQASNNPAPAEATPVPSAEVSFTAHIPAPLAEGDILAISLLDEVTGLALNASSYPMEALDAQTYRVSLPLPLNAVVKYRYRITGNARAQETTSDNMTVRYRMYKVDGASTVEDAITSWTGQTYTGVTGHIQGLAVDSVSGQSIPNLLISAGGVQTISDASGHFYLEGVASGLHLLTAYAMDASYQPFQQGAQVEANLTTPVQIHVAPAAMVNVTFMVKLPENTIQGAPLRIAGNIQQLGNTFGDLSGGFSAIADRMPTMTSVGDGRYSLTMSLPIGTDLRYKYTLGDGFWNAEHNAAGDHVIRQLVVPESDIVVEDTVDSWQAGPSSAIVFNLNVPDNTPAGDVIYIQFSPYAWTEPIPMWSMGNNNWTYKLYGPFNIITSMGYRYCRNAQCGSADDIATMGNAIAGRQIAPSLAPQDIRDTVTEWAWLGATEPYTVVAANIQASNPDFLTGVEFQSNYAPNWTNFTAQAMQNISALHANWVFLSPSWSITQTTPFILSPQPSTDPLLNDVDLMMQQASALNLNIALFPTPNFPTSADDWWLSAPRDFGWWNEWFDRYHQYLLHYADVAAKNNASALVLGGEWLAPAMQNGLLADGQASSVPADAELRWGNIINDVRTHFGGEIWWALPYTPGSLESAPSFIKNVDGVYLLWNASLGSDVNVSKDAMTSEAIRLLEEEISPYQVSVEKKIILGLALPSTTGVRTACIADPAGGCLDWQQLSRPEADIPSVGLNLLAQADVYESLFNAINGRSWIDGIVSRGYYPPTMLRDKSASVYGKPAGDLLWYWYPRLRGMAQ